MSEERIVILCTTYYRGTTEGRARIVVLLREVQERAFSTDVQKLQLKPTSNSKFASVRISSESLSKLDPYLGSDGLFHVGGRLKKTALPDDVRHLVIIPKTTHVAQLIINHFHEKTLHAGRGITFNAIRSSGYWRHVPGERTHPQMCNMSQVAQSPPSAEDERPPIR